MNDECTGNIFTIDLPINRCGRFKKDLDMTNATASEKDLDEVNNIRKF